MKNMKQRISLCILLLTATLTGTWAQEFKSLHLKQAATVLALDSALLQQTGTCYPEVKGQTLVVRVNEKKVVEHIGIPLFSPSLCTVLPSPIYDFMEYATLDHKYHINENTLQKEEVKFLKGSWKELEQLSDTVPCTIDNLEGKTYRITWQRDGYNDVVVTVPVSYELLANSTRREMEANFVRDLTAFADTTTAHIPLAVDSTQLKGTDTDGIFVASGSNYLIPSINDNIYVQKGKEGQLRLIYDGRYPAESLANMLLSPAASIQDVNIEVNISLSTYKNEKVEMPLRNFLAFCRSQGCTPYFGFEGTTKGDATGTLLMSNRSAGYDHIIYIQCPTSEIGNDLLLRAHAYLFTPSSNVKNLFADKEKHFKSIIIWK